MTSENLRWMLNQLADREGVRDVVLASSDGLPRACSQGLDRDDLDRFAAGLSAVCSTGAALGELVSDSPADWRQTMIEFERGLLLLVRGAENSLLGVIIESGSEVEQVAYHAHELASQMGQALTTAPRRADQQ
ncbi:hypothetical protein GCM10027160_37560 [Streptomyces calidiresistens]|uniref:Roadblock/LC7 domain-containing protein n=1 Tax=Streptomyces calidiresistens TaxID=1485586 RepID=A0A7W3T7V8_9ACTN|nr:roadblock/LC7 domain-containing protein [Streptomyces calidiresistens]MBB0232590.1 roadblock/LC7 domain-containing protein [Streptomyces calidiresistens]